MGLYFMLSSYLAPRSFDRKGAASFAIDRLKRLGIPLLFYFGHPPPADELCHECPRGVPGTFTGSTCSSISAP